MSKVFKTPINADINNLGSASSFAGFSSASNASYSFYSGALDSSGSSAKFSVTPTGVMVSNSASIAGSVIFTAGTLGNWTVSSSGISNGNINGGSANFSTASVSGTFSASNISLTGNLTASAGTATLGTTNHVGAVNLAAGSATIAPLYFAAGTNMTSPAGGEMEYNGTSFFLSGRSNSTTGRGIVLAPQTIRTVTTRAKANNNTSLEAVFDTANDTITLDAGLVYYFRGTYLVGKSATGVTATINTGFNFSASTSNIGYTVISYPQATGTAQQSTYVSASTSTAVTATSTTAASYVLQLEGWFVSNGGTFVPAFTQSTSGTAAAPAILGNSWFMLQAMGTSSATNIAGSWA